jgi:N-acetylglucosaminyldiphosphoundecaprenol N-acetyl-beta-D-mannosaminyltransferase
VSILGVEFDPVTLDEAVQRISAAVEDRREGRARGVPRGPGAKIVVTANPEFVQAASRDAELRLIAEQADLVLPDGIGIVWAGMVQGTPFPERVAGADLIEALLRHGAGRGWRFFLLGGKPVVSGAAPPRIMARFPGVVIAGATHGYFAPEEEPGVIEMVNGAGADVLLVGLGSPRQERWMWRNRDSLSAAVCIGVGGTIDVLAGAVRRAPEAWRRLGLEWLYRLCAQPSRIRRAWRLPAFALRVLMARLRRDAGER